MWPKIGGKKVPKNLEYVIFQFVTLVSPDVCYPSPSLSVDKKALLLKDFLLSFTTRGPARMHAKSAQNTSSCFSMLFNVLGPWKTSNSSNIIGCWSAKITSLCFCCLSLANTFTSLAKCKVEVKSDVAAEVDWIWMGWKSPGGVKYRAAYAANNCLYKAL